MRYGSIALNFGSYTTPTTSITVNATQDSIAIWADHILRCSVQVVVTSGTANGSIQLQASLDLPVGTPPEYFQPTNWSNIGSSTAITTTGVFMIPYIETSYQYLRVVYTDASGGTSTATLTGRLDQKGL